MRCSRESVKQAPDVPPRPAGSEEKGEMVVSVMMSLKDHMIIRKYYKSCGYDLWRYFIYSARVFTIYCTYFNSSTYFNSYLLICLAHIKLYKTMLALLDTLV